MRSDRGSHSMREQLGSDFYDRMHADADDEVTSRRYAALFRKVVTSVLQHGSRSVLEVGCGGGFLARMLLREYTGAYRGFDFSTVAAHNAGLRTGLPELFAVGDALDAQCYAGDYDTIVCTEVLEHIDADLEVVRLWRAGTWCVCSVPNFDYDGHVRFFNTARQVATRYGELIDIAYITKTPRPIIPDRRLSSYLRNLRWSRNDPSQLMGFLGIQTFSRLGGWFLFCGTKRGQNRVACG
jgi:2-polyprenyl-3-methyl-5-hydroxy-6-metoxy-1,4-benzoquinol methylase